MSPPKMVKYIQCLNRKIVALSRFISKSVEHYLPFFQTLKYPKNLWWMGNAKKLFMTLKIISAPQLLGRLNSSEELFLYLAISPSAMSTLLFQENDRVQKPIY